MRAATSLAILSAVNGVSAFWRMPCRGRLAVARIDPLISPGEVAQHAHTIHGSNSFSENATYSGLMGGQCTSCGVTEDKSAYWAPALYFHGADGSYQLVQQVGGMLNYYFLNQDRNNPNGKITAFPEGFRMIAGDSLRRNYSISGQDFTQADPPQALWASLGQISQVDLAQRALGFNCLNYNKAPEGSLYRHYLPEKSYLDANCADGVRFEIMFPSCWNGKDLDSPNHRDHVAYPDNVMTGGCPAGFDVKLPSLFYETIWATNAFDGQAGEFVIANGDTQGFGYHADFMTGWDVNFLQQAVNQCTNLSGNVQDCPIFTLQTEDQMNQCSMALPPVLASEKVVGNIGAALPGNVQIQYGPGPATNANPGPQTTTVAVPTVGYSEGTKPTDSAYLPGQVFKEGSAAAPAATPSQDTTSQGLAALAVPAVTPAPEPSSDDGYPIIRTDYVTVGHMVSMIIVKEKIEYVTVTTATVTSTIGLKPRHEAHMHRHNRRHLR